MIENLYTSSIVHNH